MTQSQCPECGMRNADASGPRRRRRRHRITAASRFRSTVDNRKNLVSSWLFSHFHWTDAIFPDSFGMWIH